MRMSYSYLLSVLLIIACFFPFVGPNLGTDTMPFALLFALLLLLINRRYLSSKSSKVPIIVKYKNYIIVGLLIIGLWAFISVFSIGLYPVAKRMFSYVSFFLIPISVYFAICNLGVDKFQIIVKVSIIVWGIVGVIQLLFDRSFLTNLLSISRTTDNRGVCSLASEPSFYGYMCFFMLFLALDLKKYRNIYILCLFVQIVVCAQSTVTLIYLGIFGVVYFLYTVIHVKSKKMLKIIGLGLLAILMLKYMMKTHPDSRITLLINRFFEKGLDIVFSDQSVAERIGSLAVSFEERGVPQYIGKTMIMSGFGGAFYELSILLVPIIIFTGKIIKKSDGLGMVYAITFLIVMFSAIQLSSPMVALYLGYCLWKYSNKSIDMNNRETKGNQNEDWNRFALGSTR